MATKHKPGVANALAKKAAATTKKAEPKKAAATTKEPKPKKAAPNKAKLSPQLEALAKEYRISDSVMIESGTRYVTDEVARAGNGCRLSAPTHWDLSGTAFLYQNRDGEVVYCRLRRDNFDEDAGESKYHGTRSEDSERILYCHPRSAERLKNPNTIVVVVESEKVCLALESWAEREGCDDYAFVAIGGAYGWKSREHGVLPDVAAVCKDHDVIIMLDANVSTNKNVNAARIGFTAYLQSLKRTVYHANLPQIEGVNGPDDLLGQRNGDKLFGDVLASVVKASVAPFSEHALAERFVAENADKVLYVIGIGWFLWDGQLWKRDDGGSVEILIQELCRAAASDCPKPSEQNKLRSRRTREAIQREAQAHLAISVDELDKDVRLLNTPGGTVDLRTGKLRPARREDYCTKIAGATPSAKNPTRWRKFVNEITKGDKDLEDYLQRIFGCCLTGDVRDQVYFFFYGTGANGKSVFTETMKNVLSDYAKTAQAEMLMATHHPQHATSTAALQGKRLVTVSEVEDGSRWAESKMKELTGGTGITARYMRQDEITFFPQFKLVISGNHQPKLRNTDEAMLRRTHMVPFTAYFPEDKRDTKLMQKLQPELGGILQWAIEGCLAWQREGLRPPSAVLEATKDYFTTQDTLGAWLDEKTIDDKQKTTRSSDLYNSFRIWCETRGEYVPSQKDFSQKLIDRGFVKHKSNGSVVFHGLRLPTQEEAVKNATQVLKFAKS